MAERFKALLLKSSVPERVPWVRIPPPPQVQALVMQDTTDTAIYLGAASERFQNVYREFSAAVNRTFPMVGSTFAHGMPGFRALVTDTRKEDRRGTFLNASKG